MFILFRHKPQAIVLLMYNFLKYHNLPVTLVATKVDKVNTTTRDKQQRIILDSIDLVLNDDFVMFSSVSKEGKVQVQDMIETIISGS